MKTQEVQIGKRIVKSKADVFTIGKIGTIIDVNFEKGRVQVEWEQREEDANCCASKTWIRFDAVEDESIQYIITKYTKDPRTHKHIWPKYKRA